jgi:branched-chain amino acid transport system permease protein
MRLKLLAAAIIAIALPFVVPSDYWMRLINMALIFGMLTISLNIVLGYAGLISLGHAGLFGIGAYVAALLTHGRSGVLFVPAFLAAGVLTAAVGFCVGLPALRLRGHYLALSTLGFGEIVSSLLLNWRSLTYGQNGVGEIPAPSLFGINLDTDARFYWLLVVVAGLTLLFSRRLALSRHGRLLFAVRDAELAAGCAGVNVPAIKLTAFTLSAGIAGLAGALYAHLMAYISPDVFGFDVTAQILCMVVVGGLGSVAGPMIGAALLTFLPEVLRIGQAYYQLLYGAGMIALVIYLPFGLAGIRARRPRQTDHAALQPLHPPPHAQPPRTPADRPLLEATGIRMRFGGLVAIDELSFAVQPGTIHALIGPNGSGKSTFINIASGLYRPTAGAVRFDGRVISGTRPWRIAQAGLARSFQNVHTFRSLTVTENLLVGCRDAKMAGLVGDLANTSAARAQNAELRRRAERALDLVGLWSVRDQPIAGLPHEQQRLAEIARCVAMQARMIMLDEPAAGMNPAEVDRLIACLRSLRQTGITILLVEHNMPMVMRVADQITVLNFGRRIAEGSPAAIRADPQVINAYLGRRAATSHAA